MLNQYRVAIAQSALRKAQDNYQKKYEKIVSEATENASIDVAQYRCQMLPSGMNGVLGFEQTSLGTPYAISYDIDEGLDLQTLMVGGKYVDNLAGGVHTNQDKSKISNHKGGFGAVTIVGGAGGGWNNSKNKTNTVSINIDGGKKEVTSVFNRETRICHVCTTTSVENCEQLKVKGTKVKKKNCVTDVQESCEDVQL